MREPAVWLLKPCWEGLTNAMWQRHACGAGPLLLGQLPCVGFLTALAKAPFSVQSFLSYVPVGPGLEKMHD